MGLTLHSVLIFASDAWKDESSRIQSDFVIRLEFRALIPENEQFNSLISFPFLVTFWCS